MPPILPTPAARSRDTNIGALQASTEALDSRGRARLILGRRQLEHVLRLYISHFNRHRPHRGSACEPQTSTAGRFPSQLRFDRYKSGAATFSVGCSTNTKPRREIDFVHPTGAMHARHLSRRAFPAFACVKRSRRRSRCEALPQSTTAVGRSHRSVYARQPDVRSRSHSSTMHQLRS
jgi:hypothetical protein